MNFVESVPIGSAFIKSDVVSGVYFHSLVFDNIPNFVCGTCIYNSKPCLQFLNSTTQVVFVKSYLLGLKDFVVIFPAEFRVVDCAMFLPSDFSSRFPNSDLTGELALSFSFALQI